MGKEWDVLEALETMVGGVTGIASTTIGFQEDSFHERKFSGTVPAAFLEYRGNAEEGPHDSSFERYVPFTVTVVLVFKAKSGKQNRREKIETAIDYKNRIANALDADPQLTAKQVTVSTIAETRVLEADVRVRTPYWAFEMDLSCAVWEDKAGR